MLTAQPTPVRLPANVLGLSSQATGDNKYGHSRSASSGGAISYAQPQVIYTRPSLPHHPASFMTVPATAPPTHTSHRYAYVAPTAMVPSAANPGAYIQRSSTPGPYPPQQRVSREPSHGGGTVRVSQDPMTRLRQSNRDRSAPPPSGTPHVRAGSGPRSPRAVDSEESEDDGGYASNSTRSGYPYGAPMPSLSRANTGQSNAPRPIMRKRTTSSSGGSNGSVHFTPDNLFLTFPSPHTLKLSNIPRFGSQSLMRAIREKVITMWLPGVTFSKEGRGEYIVGFAGLDDGAVAEASGLNENDRKNWGLWTARGAEGITALRLLTSIFVTFAAQGFSYLASLHCLPPQLIFTTTPSDVSSRFLAVEITVTPLPRKKQKVNVTDPDTGDFILSKKVKVDISHVGVRCVDFPEDVLRAVVGAVRNTGRDGAGVHAPKADAMGAAGEELLEFGVQGERWDTKGVYVLDSVISRGTGKRAVSSKEIARARADRRQHSNMPEVIEADTDTLPVLLSHVLKALSSNGYRLEASVPLPLPVPLVDPFSQYGSQQTGGHGLGSFLSGLFDGDGDGDARRGHGREVWMFRSVGWFEES